MAYDKLISPLSHFVLDLVRSQGNDLSSSPFNRWKDKDSERFEWQTVLSHLEGMQPLVTYLQGQEKSLSTEMAHSIFADAYFPEQAQGHILLSGQDFWRRREIET